MTDFDGPQGLRTRGTVLVVPGRGETVRSYARLGARLAADAYRVRVLEAPAPDGDLEASLDLLAERLDEALGGLDLVSPLVLVGVDSGAAAVAALVGRQQRRAAWWPQAVVLAGLPGYDAPAAGGWDAELDARTKCPVHRAVLSDDVDVQRGGLDVPLPGPLLDTAYGSTAGVPHLLLVGDADAHADRDALERLAKALPLARLAIVRGVRHDVLNDVQHRAVAAEVVAFLEAVRAGTPPVPLVSVESSDW